ncbi:beta glucosidase 9 [Actinidia rufa]|uniref:Beta glucosidase 9 n=1 Tax=Actinidia rufa TaxID=165716 RepID=A0A7J0FJV7_9ERIC|nr:beta glucosidase 9 [Actinidia rufa]
MEDGLVETVDSSSEPYIAAHNILLAQASVANLYKNKYQGKQQGFIGININVSWYVPSTNTTEDVIATQKSIDFYVGRFVDPLVFGDYADIMKKNAGTRIPAFTELESKQVKGSFDFIGGTTTPHFNQGDTPPSPGEFPIIPSGLVRVLEYFKQCYGNSPIYENGQRTDRNTTRQDTGRVKHMHGYIGALLDAVRCIWERERERWLNLLSKYWALKALRECYSSSLHIFLVNRFN